MVADVTGERMHPAYLWALPPRLDRTELVFAFSSRSMAWRGAKVGSPIMRVRSLCSKGTSRKFEFPVDDNIGRRNFGYLAHKLD